ADRAGVTALAQIAELRAGVAPLPVQGPVNLAWGLRAGLPLAEPAPQPYPFLRPRHDTQPARLVLAILCLTWAGRSLDMPKIRPAPKADRLAFGKQLPKGQRPHFAELAHLVEQHRTDLDWYHAVGKLVRDLRDAIPSVRRGKGWAAALAVALGV